VRIQTLIKRLALIVVVFALSAWPTTASDENQVDAVVQFVIPNYNGMYPGTVIVFNVIVDQSGDVVYSQYVLADPPAPMLPTWAKEALEEWTFVEADDPGYRDFEVRFVFESRVSMKSSGEVRTTLEPPLTMRVVCDVPNIAMVERAGGNAPQETCALHGVAMDVTVVPSRYPCRQFGHPVYSRKEINRMARFEKAMERLFPNAPINAVADRDAVIDGEAQDDCASFAEAYYCPECLEARAGWCKAHTKMCPE
jgi:hypothetical protein